MEMNGADEKNRNRWKKTNHITLHPHNNTQQIAHLRQKKQKNVALIQEGPDVLDIHNSRSCASWIQEGVRFGRCFWSSLPIYMSCSYGTPSSLKSRACGCGRRGCLNPGRRRHRMEFLLGATVALLQLRQSTICPAPIYWVGGPVYECVGASPRRLPAYGRAPPRGPQAYGRAPPRGLPPACGRAAGEDELTGTI
ncbi:unnamed protein product [Urochloa humidicola]